MRKTAYASLLLLLIIAFAVSGFAQQPQFKTKAEYDAYNAAYTATDPAKKAELAAKYLTDYKDPSDPSFKMNAYIMMTKGYLDAKNFPKAMEAAAKVDEAVPGLAADKKAQIYGYGMAAAQQADDVPKTVEFGEKVLSAAPNDVNTLITLAGLIPERLPTDEAGKKAALDKAEGFAKRGLTELGKIQKPAAMSDADWAAIGAGLHSSLGFVHLNRLEYDKSIEEYQQVVKATPKDGIAHFRMGLAYSGQAAALSKEYVASVDQQNEAIKNNAEKTAIDELKTKSDDLEQKLRAKRTQATDELATAVAIGGPVQQPAMDQLKKLWTGTPEEMNQLIASKKPQ
jgi:tetratricopeptide (TPR) repeat protein